MEDNVLETLKDNAVKTKDPKEALDWSRAYGEIMKADTERLKVEWNAQDQDARTALEKAKVDCDVVIRKTQVDNDRYKVDKEFESQCYKANRSSKDAMWKAGAVLGATVGLTVGERIFQVIVSKNASNIFRIL